MEFEDINETEWEDDSNTEDLIFEVAKTDLVLVAWDNAVAGRFSVQWNVSRIVLRLLNYADKRVNIRNGSKIVHF